MPSAFSAARAFSDVEQIAQRPHPTGSPDLIRVRAYLVGRLAALGMNPTVRSGIARPPRGEARLVHNIAGVLPGTDSALPAIMLMSHYDSVATGPGAGDDAAGVAAALEIARAVKAAGPRRRDLIVLITDGEEAGLLGATAFFKDDALAKRVGLIINMEARGNSGRAVMFETHRDAAPLIARLNRAGAMKGASSLMPDLYRRLPNDTDLSPALKAGHMGLNLAFFGGQAHYHQPTDTPANLDRASLQHLGGQALAAVLALIDDPAPPGRAADQTYADILGGPVVQYPPLAGWALIVLAAGLTVVAWRRRRAPWLDVLLGMGRFVLIIALPAVLLYMAANAAAGAFPALLARYPVALAGYVLITLGGLLSACCVHQWRGPVDPFGVWLGGLLLGAVTAVALQILAPLDSFMVAWPLLAGAITAALMAGNLPAPRALARAVAALALAQVFYWAGLMFQLIGVATPLILATFAFLAGLVAIGPVLQATASRHAAWVGGGAALTGAGLLVFAALA